MGNISLILRNFSYELIYLLATRINEQISAKKIYGEDTQKGGIWLRGSKYFQNTLMSVWKLPGNLFCEGWLIVTPNASLLLAMLQWNISDYLRFKCPNPGHLTLHKWTQPTVNYRYKWEAHINISIGKISSSRESLCILLFVCDQKLWFFHGTWQNGVCAFPTSTAVAAGCDRYLEAAQGQTGVFSGGDVNPGSWASLGKAGGLQGRNM